MISAVNVYEIDFGERLETVYFFNDIKKALKYKDELNNLYKEKGWRAVAEMSSKQFTEKDVKDFLNKKTSVDYILKYENPTELFD